MLKIQGKILVRNYISEPSSGTWHNSFLVRKVAVLFICLESYLDTLIRAVRPPDLSLYVHRISSCHRHHCLKGVLKQNGENHWHRYQANNQHMRRFPRYANTLLEAEGDCTLGPEIFGPPFLRPREQQRDLKCRSRIIPCLASHQVKHSSSHPTRLQWTMT